MTQIKSLAVGNSLTLISRRFIDNASGRTTYYASIDALKATGVITKADDSGVTIGDGHWSISYPPEGAYQEMHGSLVVSYLGNDHICTVVDTYRVETIVPQKISPTPTNYLYQALNALPATDYVRRDKVRNLITDLAGGSGGAAPIPHCCEALAKAVVAQCIVPDQGTMWDRELDFKFVFCPFCGTRIRLPDTSGWFSSVPGSLDGQILADLGGDESYAVGRVHDTVFWAEGQSTVATKIKRWMPMDRVLKAIQA